MEFDLSLEEAGFRDEVKAFLEAELTEEVRGGMFVDTPARVAFVDKLAAKGWLGMGFPEKYGGSKKPIALAQFILNVELELAHAPIVGKNVGVIANTIFHTGSEEMKDAFLPKVFKNECQWALSYTEPQAGTDLAALQCKCEDKGDHWLVNGTKRFITSAHFADYHWVAVRTDPDAQKHKGVSIIIMDADAEGLTYTPQWCVGSTGAERTNEVFYDNVKVPKNRLVGEINKGFIYLMQALDYERFAIISFAARVRRFNKVAEWGKEAEFGGKKLSDDPAIRSKFATLATRVEIGTMLEKMCICVAAERVPNTEAAMNKAWASTIGTEIANLALDAMGPYGYLWDGSEHAPLEGEMVDQYLMHGHSRVAAAGVDTSKTIIARRLLGLPDPLGKPFLPNQAK